VRNRVGALVVYNMSCVRLTRAPNRVRIGSSVWQKWGQGPRWRIVGYSELIGSSPVSTCLPEKFVQSTYPFATYRALGSEPSIQIASFS
jgi:hypothetical protein